MSVENKDLTDEQLKVREKMLHAQRERAYETYQILDGALHGCRNEINRRRELRESGSSSPT